MELATTSFGQGVSVTAIQQIAAVSATINGGILYKPYIVKSIVHPDTGEIILENKPQKVKKIISEDTSKAIRMALETVVAHGTGRNAYIDSYRVGGKTGTAQKVNNGIYMVGNYILSFIGFLPADNPQVILYLAVDNPKGITQYGGTVAAPIAKNILVDCISALGIKKSEGGLEKEYLWYDQKHYKVPNVVNMSLEEAKKKLTKFQIEYAGTGNIVKSMSPEPGSYIAENETVRLLLGSLHN